MKSQRRRRRGCLILALVVTLPVLLVVAVAAGRVLLYRQSDDAAAVASKQTYLDTIAGAATEGEERLPNLVVILFDDLGLGDLELGLLEPNGDAAGRAVRTPHIDALARRGVVFRNGYATSPYCSASRAGLLTGRYPVRMGLDHVVQAPGTFTDVLERFGGLNRRLPLEEITLAEVLEASGYSTAIVGKWHLGDESPSLPTDRGFDSFFGLLHSNDQGKPTLLRDRSVVEAHPIDQSTLTRRYTEEAVAFLERSADRPFFLYLAHTFPHIPLHASQEFRGRSAAGLYGDVVEELDWSTGEVIAALERLGIADDTLVLVTSDNGPWFQGSSGGTRGRKFHVFEGGTRVPFVAVWPQRIAAGTVRDDPVVGIDLFPTFLAALGLPLPQDRQIDGRSFLPLSDTEVVAGAERAVYYFQLGALRAVRSGRYKYHDRHRVFFGNPMNWSWAPTRNKGPWLFDLELDAGEVYDVSTSRPQEAARLRALLDAQRAALAENLAGWR